MLIIKVVQGENIERALKRFRQKFRNTQQMKQIRNNKQFTKKSQQKREELAKAVYKEEYIRKAED